MIRSRLSIRTIFIALTFLQLLLLADRAVAQSTYEVKSPGGGIPVTIRIGERLTYDVSLKGKALLQYSSLSLDIDHHKLCQPPKVRSVERNTADVQVKP